MKKEYIAASIGAIATVIAAIIANNVGKEHGIEETYSEINAEISDVSGDATININNISDFVSDYESLKSENETLKEKNNLYFEDLQVKNHELEIIKDDIGNNPSITFQDMKLVINTEDKPVNSSKSLVVIDGREYIDKDFFTNAISQEQNMTIKDDTLYIGKIIADKANLHDQWLMDRDKEDFMDMCFGNHIDSFGNNYINSLDMHDEEGVIYSLNKKYSKLKFKLSSSEINSIKASGYLIIKADDQIVYTSQEITIKTEPFIVEDIPLNNCSLLTLQVSSDNYSGFTMILADAIVYN